WRGGRSPSRRGRGCHAARTDRRRATASTGRSRRGCPPVFPSRAAGYGTFPAVPRSWRGRSRSVLFAVVAVHAGLERVEAGPQLLELAPDLLTGAADLVEARPQVRGGGLGRGPRRLGRLVGGGRGLAQS